MESKTKKTTKAAAKTTTKASVKNDEIVVKNQIDYTTVLNRIFYCLLVIAIILGLNFILNVVTNTDSKSTGTNNIDETENTEYDVSKFDTLSTTDAIAKINEGGTQVVYIGRATCGYCVKFLPIMEQAQQDLGFKTIYINLEEVTTEDQAKLIAYDSYVEENFGYTPMVLVFKDGKYVDGWVGYAEVDSYKSFLAEAGIK